MRGFTTFGKQVKDTAGEHFADAVSDVAAKLIVAALNWRAHRPVISDGEVICSRCQSLLPEDGAEPCVPKTPRCSDTPDLFGGDNAAGQVQPVRPEGHRGTEWGAAVQRAPKRKHRQISEA